MCHYYIEMDKWTKIEESLVTSYLQAWKEWNEYPMKQNRTSYVVFRTPYGALRSEHGLNPYGKFCPLSWSAGSPTWYALHYSRNVLWAQNPEPVFCTEYGVLRSMLLELAGD